MAICKRSKLSQQITSDSISGLSAGVYNLSVQDVNGCVNSIIHQISEPEPISVVQITSSPHVMVVVMEKL